MRPYALKYQVGISGISQIDQTASTVANHVDLLWVQPSQHDTTGGEQVQDPPQV